ncbi:MAG: argininosuccinate synthase [Thermodesulfobacteriota bacterium]
MKKIKKVVLAYSGGLDTSVIPRWLIETYGCEVIAFCADLGQDEPSHDLKKRALKSGISKVYVKDLREEFVRDFVFPLLRANAVYEGTYLLGTAIARPLIAKWQISVARKEKADAVSHGATGKGNDQVRFELTYLALNPKIKIIAPWRLWHLNSRQSLIAYAKKHKLPIKVSAKKPYSIDRNLLHVSFEGGILEDPWQEPKQDMFILTHSPEKAPGKPTYLEISYKQGNPIAINKKPLSPATLLEKLNKLGGVNGIGRVDMVENRYVGIKSRGVYETPGGTILHIAHRAMESITLDREVMHLKDSLITKYAELVYYGYWFSPEREILQLTIDETQKNVTGTVRLKLYKGNCMVVGRKSPNPLYHPDYATFEEDTVYDQKLADGFIQLNALRLKIRKLSKSKK